MKNNSNVYTQPEINDANICACMLTPFKARVATFCWNQYFLAL